MTLRSAARIRALYQTEDKALEAANDLLDAAVCECSHFDSDHLAGNKECCAMYEGPRCSCRKFRPVRFTVERAK